MTLLHVLLDALGIIGDIMILGVYGLLQSGRIEAESGLFLWANIIGSFAVLASLWAEWSVTLCFVQTAWLIISLFGLLRVGRSSTASLPVAPLKS